MRRSYAIPMLAPALLWAACSGDGDTGPSDGEATTVREAAFAVVEGPSFTHQSGASGEFYFPEIAGAGGALVDYDGDGDLDLYAVQGGSVEVAYRGSGRQQGSAGDRLFRLDSAAGAMEWVDVTESAGFEATGYGMGVAVGDVDNDGSPDLFVTNAGPNQLWRNNGDGTFSDATSTAGLAGDRWSISASFFDYDNDGWLDLYVTNYVDFRLETHRDCRATSGALDYCGPLSYNPEPDRLYRNRGDGTFEDVSASAGVSERSASGLGVTAADFDRDGWTDLFVANDQMVNFLWMNQGDGTFVESAALAGCAVNMEGNEEASMGVVAADLDEDGALDLFMTHLDGETNTLYMGDGGGLFEDRTAGRGLAAPSLPSTGFGTVAVDFDNDGWQDIFVANGAVYTIERLRAQGDPFPFRQQDQLYRNQAGGVFAEVEEPVSGLDRPQVGRGVAAGDPARRGLPTLVIFNDEGPLRRLVSTGGIGDWLGVQALLGATVVTELADGTRRHRRIHRDGSYCSSQDPAARVGLGDGLARSVRIDWPRGGSTLLHDPPSRRYLRFGEPGGV